MMLPVSGEALRDELSAIMKIVSKWQERFSGGVPIDELPGDADAANTLMQFCGEMLLCAGKCEALSGILSTDNR